MMKSSLFFQDHKNPKPHLCLGVDLCTSHTFLFRVLLPSSSAWILEAVPVQQLPSHPSSRLCPIAPSCCFPACCWLCPSLWRLAAGSGSSEQLTKFPRAHASPFPITPWLWCDPEAISPLSPYIPLSIAGLSPATHHCWMSGYQPLPTTDALQHWHRSSPWAGHQHGPPQPWPPFAKPSIPT